MRKLISVLMLLLSTSANGMDVEKDDRVLNLNGCTGFMVDGNYLLTAKHCNLGDKIILNQSKNIVANLVYSPSTSDGPVVYHVPGKRFKSFRVADKVPTSGSKVYSIGYPGGNYAVITGTMIGTIGNKNENVVGMRVNPGHSGGPLLSDNGEVIGVTLSVPHNLDINNSNFASWGSVVKAMKAARENVGSGEKSYKRKRELVIFSYEGCVPCKNLDDELDYSELNKNGIVVIKVMLRGNKWSNQTLVEEFKRVNRKSPDSFPTMWIRGTNQYRVGYKKGTRLSVLGWVISGFKSIGLFLFGSDPSGEIKDEPEFTPAPPSILPDDVPEPKSEDGPLEPQVYKEDVDWENVSIIIAAKKQSIGYTRGKALEIVLRSIKGPIQRANAEFFEGKANIFFVDERTQPVKYSSFVTAAGVDFERFYVIVLVKKQSLGLKGLIASRVESSILNKLPEGIPIEIVFERVHSDSYFAITKSLTVSDTPVQVPNPDESMKDDIIGAFKAEMSVVKSDISNIKIPDDASFAEKMKAQIVPAVVEAAKPKNEDGTERTWLMRIMAGAMTLLGLAKGAGGVRGFLLKRAMNRAKKVAGIS